LSLLFYAFLPAEWRSFVSDLFHQKTDYGFFLILVRIFLLANISVLLLRALLYIFTLGMRTEILLAGSFAAVIIVGTLLFQLPRVSSHPDAEISLVDGFFTATSAVCVTGLAVRDTGSDFTHLGHLIIFGLFQIGGLGIVTFIAFLSVFSERSLPVPQMVAFRSIINAPAAGNLKRRLLGIILVTLSVEMLGAALLFVFTPEMSDPFYRLKWGVFHSVSAFCNAGFSLESDGLEGFAGNHGVVITIMGLIVFGGLGFLVIPEVISFFFIAIHRLPVVLLPRRRRFVNLSPMPRLSVQTRLSLVVTAFLIFGGTLGFWLLEHAHILQGRPTFTVITDSFFQSITTRTAGFNTLPIGELQQSTLILIIALMIVGGSPVSTAGGIKTVTFGLLVLALRSLLFQKQRIEAFGRTLAPRVLFTALNVFILYMVTGGVCLFLLTLTDPHLALRDTLFETFSALGTVGLSTGITPGLSTGGKLTLCMAMFVGRVGPIALVLSVFQSRDRVEYEFPTEDVVVG
ncbi:MAG: TrkH family potassium uptake protein, partial [Chthoniobacterales bacterium]